MSYTFPTANPVTAVQRAATLPSGLNSISDVLGTGGGSGAAPAAPDTSLAPPPPPPPPPTPPLGATTAASPATQATRAAAAAAAGGSSFARTVLSTPLGAAVPSTAKKQLLGS